MIHRASVSQPIHTSINIFFFFQSNAKKKKSMGWFIRRWSEIRKSCFQTVVPVVRGFLTPNSVILSRALEKINTKLFSLARALLIKPYDKPTINCKKKKKLKRYDFYGQDNVVILGEKIDVVVLAPKHAWFPDFSTSTFPAFDAS